MITLTGTFTSDAVPTYTNTAEVNSSDDPNPALNIATDTVAVVPAIVTPTTTVTPAVPHVEIIKQTTDGDTYNVGDQVTFVLAVKNDPDSIDLTAPITVEDTLPIGLTDISAKGFFWSINLSSTSGAATVEATYLPSKTIQPGDDLPFIYVTGTLTHDIIGQGSTSGVFTNTATVTVQGAQAEATSSIFVNDQKNNDQSNNGQNNNGQNNNNDQNNNGQNNNGQNNDHNININDQNNGHNNNDQNNNNGTHFNGTGTPGMPLTGSDPIAH